MKIKNLFIKALALVACLMCSMSSAMAQEAYACYTSDNTTLTFYYDNFRIARTGTTYDLNTSYDTPGWSTDDVYSSVTQVVFDPSFASARPTTTFCWFFKMSQLASITGMNYLNTSSVTIMQNMFAACTSLTRIDLSNFNTASVVNMDGMFFGCESLTSLNLSSFNTANVINMGLMFMNCSQLVTIIADSLWSIASVQTSDSMFSGCPLLAGGMGTCFDPYHTDASYAHIDGGTNDPGYFTESYYDFIVDNICYSIIDELNVEVRHHQYPNNCYAGSVHVPETVDYNGNTYNVSSIGAQAFAYSPNLTYLCIPASVKQVKSGICLDCTALKKVDWYADYHAISDWAFKGCTSLTSFSVPEYIDAIYLDAFEGCSGLLYIECHASTPPNVEEGPFDDQIYSNTKLYVPFSAMQAYQNTTVGTTSTECPLPMILLKEVWDSFTIPTMRFRQHV